MKLRILLVAASMLCSAAYAAPPAGFEQRVEQLRTQFGVPGVSVAIVENGKPTLTRGWGVRTVGTKDPVDADTIFPTGSTGKAFTVTLQGQGTVSDGVLAASGQLSSSSGALSLTMNGSRQ